MMLKALAPLPLIVGIATAVAQHEPAMLPDMDIPSCFGTANEAPASVRALIGAPFVMAGERPGGTVSAVRLDASGQIAGLSVERGLLGGRMELGAGEFGIVRTPAGSPVVYGRAAEPEGAANWTSAALTRTALGTCTYHVRGGASDTRLAAADLQLR